MCDRVLSAVVCGLLAVIVPAVLLSAIGTDAAIMSPLENELFQRAGSAGDIPFAVLSRGRPVQVELRDADGRSIARSATQDGHFSRCAPAFYRVCAVRVGWTLACRRVGVGDVFLVAGQSNALSTAQRHEPVWSSSGRVVIAELETSSAAPSFVLPTRESPTTSSVAWLAFGELWTARTGAPTGFVNIARGSSSTRDWRPAVGGLFPRFRTALSGRSYRAVLWTQGESDAMYKIPTEESYANLRAVIDETRKLAPGLRWYVALDSMRPNARWDRDSVRKAQRRLMREGAADTGPDLDVLREREEYADQSGADFVGRGQDEVGRAWFQAVGAP